MRFCAVLSTAIVLSFMAGCAAGPQMIQGEEGGAYRHYYRLIVIDGDRKPLEGATVEYRFMADSRLLRTGVLVADAEGSVLDGVNVPRNRSAMAYRVTKEGYYERSGELRSDYGAIHYDRPVNGSYVQLFRDVDYIDRHFSRGLADGGLKTTMVTFVRSFKNRENGAESTLVPWSVGMARHQNRHYFRFAVDDNTMYNSEAFFERTLVARIFRDTASPVLAFAGRHMAEETVFYGYDVTVRALCRNFCEPDDAGRIREFRFLVPETELRRYVEGFISQEKLLESATCIVDGKSFDLGGIQ